MSVGESPLHSIVQSEKLILKGTIWAGAVFIGCRFGIEIVQQQ